MIRDTHYPSTSRRGFRIGVTKIPLPPVRYTEENFHALELFSGQRSTNKLEIQTDQHTDQQIQFIKP
jgi:hypothetical protein